jgi:hypothetical protein
VASGEWPASGDSQWRVVPVVTDAGPSPASLSGEWFKFGDLEWRVVVTIGLTPASGEWFGDSEWRVAGRDSDEWLVVRVASRECQ